VTKRLPVLLSVAALSIFAAACGDDEEDSAAAGSAPAETATPTPTPMAADQDIVVLAQGERDLSTLVRAVTAAELAQTLQGPGPFTVFAPTNDAFDAVGQDTLDQLLAPSGREQLKDVLTYHVVAGDVKAADLKDGQTLETVQGGELPVSIEGEEVKVGGATVVKADVDAENGTVHVIDAVLQPTA
jgi:uncharacterized surface protein with fasciclin (FAS1) repeats